MVCEIKSKWTTKPFLALYSLPFWRMYLANNNGIALVPLRYHSILQGVGHSWYSASACGYLCPSLLQDIVGKCTLNQLRNQLPACVYSSLQDRGAVTKSTAGHGFSERLPPQEQWIVLQTDLVLLSGGPPASSPQAGRAYLDYVHAEMCSFLAPFLWAEFTLTQLQLYFAF